MGRTVLEAYTGGQFLVITLVGLAVGFVAGMFGIGGGFLIVPVLNIGLSIPMEIAVGSAACQVLGPATTSVLARRVTLEDWKLPLIIAGGLLVGVFAGAEILHRLMDSDSNSAGSRDFGEGIVLCVYLLLLIGLGGFALWESGRELGQHPIRTGWLLDVSWKPLAEIPGQRRSMSLLVIGWFGLFVGAAAGLLGISGGLLLLPGLIYLLGLEWHRAVTASMLIVWMVAVQSTVAHSLHGHIQLPIVLALLLGGTLGARLGVERSRGLSPVRGRQAFGWLALGTAAVISWKLLTLISS